MLLSASRDELRCTLTVSKCSPHTARTVPVYGCIKGFSDYNVDANTWRRLLVCAVWLSVLQLTDTKRCAGVSEAVRCMN